MKKLDKLAVEKGKSLDWIILPEVNRSGVIGAAKALGFAPSTISNWLTANGYVSRTTWQKDTTPEEKAQIDAAGERIDAYQAEWEGEGSS